MLRVLVISEADCQQVQRELLCQLQQAERTEEPVLQAADKQAVRAAGTSAADIQVVPVADIQVADTSAEQAADKQAVRVADIQAAGMQAVPVADIQAADTVSASERSYSV